MKTTNTKTLNTVRAGINELWKKNFIAPTAGRPKDVFWINPTLFFSGSRIEKYKDKLEIKATVIK